MQKVSCRNSGIVLLFDLVRTVSGKKVYFRIPFGGLLEIIKRGLDHLTDRSTVWEALKKIPYNIYVRSGKPLTVYLVRKEDGVLIKKLTEKSNPVHAGIYFGFIDNGEFRLSLEGGEFIHYELASREELGLRYIKLTEPAARSFLYGNNILPEDFISYPREMHRRDVIFVTDPHGTFIGLGYIFIPAGSRSRSRGRGKFGRRMFPEGLELRNLTDYGYYIRRGF